MNDTETISMLVTFANTIFSEHPNYLYLYFSCYFNQHQLMLCYFCLGLH